jgi:hypothetical protein
MSSCTKCSSSITENIAVSCQIESMISSTTNLLKVSHFFIILSSSKFLHLLSLLLLIIKWKHILLMNFIIFMLLIVETLLILYNIHVSFEIIMIWFLKRRSIVIFAHIVICFPTKSIWSSLLHLVFIVSLAHVLFSMHLHLGTACVHNIDGSIRSLWSMSWMS